MKRNGWLGLFVGLPLAGFAASCWMVVFGRGACPALTDGVPFLIGILMGYLVFSTERGFLRLPTEIGRIRGWCVVMLCVIAVAQISLVHLRMCRSVATYVSAPCQVNGYPAVNVSPAVFLCFEPPVFITYWRVLEMIMIGVAVVLALKVTVWSIPRFLNGMRMLWNVVSPGWSWLSAACFALLVLTSVWVEPLIRFGFLASLEEDAAGIAEIDDLVRCRDVISSGSEKRSKDGTSLELARKHLLMIYDKYGACCQTGYEHISTTELAKLSNIDRAILIRILENWDRSKALKLLDSLR